MTTTRRGLLAALLTLSAVPALAQDAAQLAVPAPATVPVKPPAPSAAETNRAVFDYVRNKINLYEREHDGKLPSVMRVSVDVYERFALALRMEVASPAAQDGVFMYEVIRWRGVQIGPDPNLKDTDVRWGRKP